MIVGIGIPGLQADGLVEVGEGRIEFLPGVPEDAAQT